MCLLGHLGPRLDVLFFCGMARVSARSSNKIGITGFLSSHHRQSSGLDENVTLDVNELSLAAL